MLGRAGVKGQVCKSEWGKSKMRREVGICWNGKVRDGMNDAKSEEL